MAGLIYDAIENLRGVYGANPHTVPPGFAHQAVNRVFREDLNKTRYSIRQVELNFENDAERTWFEGANGQGAFFYQSYPNIASPSIVCSVGGRIFRIQIGGKSGTATKLFDGNTREYLLTWFAQGYEYLAIQDGINPPVIWDGTNSPTRSDITKNQMPIGSVMAFIHGRFVVASADGTNTIRLSEIATAGNVTSRADLLNFPPELPTYSTATNLGNIQGLYPMPYLDSGTGQYELVVLCDNGFTSFDFRGEEADLLGPIQKISLIGTGCVSSIGFAGLNGDLFFRTDSGINSYRNSRLEYTQSWTQSNVSREVNYWLRNDRTDLLGIVPMVSWQGMVFTGVSPLISAPNNPCFGFHRYCRGFVVFDAQNMSTAGRQGDPVWHGMWTGVRPWSFVSGRIGQSDRCFVFSYDRDGKNRLYEITLQDGDDVFEGQPQGIFSYFTTREMGVVNELTSAFDKKTFSGGVLELSEILNESSFEVQYRPDGNPCWVNVSEGNPGCDCPETPDGCVSTSWPQWARQYFSAIPKGACVPGTSQPSNTFYHCQVKVLGTGSYTIDRLNIRMNPVVDTLSANCLKPNCLPVDCCPAEFDFSYHIAPLGTNPNVPVLTCEPPVVTYTSTRYANAFCPTTGASITAMGQATSTVSQADADQQALANAQANAQAALDCPSCTPATLVSFTIDGGSANLSAYFASGEYVNSEGRPWRLVELGTLSYVASGIVNASGTMETITTYPYAHGSWDSATNTYNDLGGGSVNMALEMGCNLNGSQTWPSSSPY